MSKGDPDYTSTMITAPFSGEDGLLAEFDRLNKESDTTYRVDEVYGSHAHNPTGTGRDDLPEITEPLEELIKKAHAVGIKFNYLYNASALGGQEYEPSKHKAIIEHIADTVAAGADELTITNPLLSSRVGKLFPKVRRSTSVNNHINSLERARQVVDYLKPDSIMLAHEETRNFGLIKAISREFPRLSLKVLVNESCNPDCVLQPSHQEFLAMRSRSGSEGKTYPDICHIFCGLQKLKNPLNVLRAPWIRPEDLHYLAAAGATHIKIAGRPQPAEWKLACITAYAKGKFHGDLWPFVEKSGMTDRLFQRMLKKVALQPCRYKVMNESLDGFIKPFADGKVPCVQHKRGCGSCTWCQKFMHAVELPVNAEERLQDLETLLEMVREGCWLNQEEDIRKHAA